MNSKPPLCGLAPGHNRAVMKTFVTATTLVAFLAGSATAQTIPNMKTSSNAGGKAVATYFTEDSVGDAQLGKLGLQKAQNAAVRALAQAMVRDHTRTANDGLQVAKQIGADEAQFKAGDDNQIELSHLARYSGTRFDQEYVSALIDAHKNDITTAHDALEFTKTPALRTYLQENITIDQHHLQVAEAAQKEVGKTD